jgi:dihydroflavonol-4-reductase
MVDLVTGGAGFIGRHLVRELRERGRSVRVLDLDRAGLADDVEVVTGSVVDPRAVARATVGVRRVFHLAGLSELWLPDKRLYDEVNVEGTRLVLEAARRAGAERIVVTSSSTVLISRRDRGEAPGTVDERRLLLPSDLCGPYCRSKLAAEDVVRRAAAAGQDVVVVNPTLPIGPGEARLLAPMRMIRDLLDRVDLAYVDWMMNLVDVRDAALGHLLAAERGRSGHRYLLGGHNLRTSDLLQRLEDMTGTRMPRLCAPWSLAYGFAITSELMADRLTGQPPRAPLTGVRLARHGRSFDIGKARRMLGYVPRPLDLTLQDTLAWLRCRDQPARVVASPVREQAATSGRAA